MRKIIILLFAVLCLSSLKAQLFSVGNVGIGYIYVGPKLGGNMATSTVDVETGTNKTFHFGYQLGGVAKFGISNKLSVQPELVYSSKGFGTDASGFETKNNYKYFGLPVVAKYAFLSLAGIQIYGAGGFYTDYLTKVTVEYVEQEETFTEELSHYKRVDFGLNFGGGATKSMKNGDQLNLDLAFTYGLTDVYEGTTNSSDKNVTVQLSAIYLFDLTKFITFKARSNQNDGYDENTLPTGGAKVEQE
jgi:hypothetical protein